MDPQLLDGKWLAVLMIADAPGGTQEEGAFFEGTATWDGAELLIHRGPGDKPFPVPENAFGRIRPVDGNLRQVFEHAEFVVPLLVGPLPEHADLAQYAATGIRWPREEAEPGRAAALRRALAEFLGQARYQKFVRQLVQAGRLRFWQEEAWGNFLDAHPQFRMGLDELRAALRLCEVHGCELQPDTVEVPHGQPEGAGEYLRAYFRWFPHAGRGQFADGARGTRVELWYCPACRAAEAAWRQQTGLAPEQPSA